MSFWGYLFNKKKGVRGSMGLLICVPGTSLSAGRRCNPAGVYVPSTPINRVLKLFGQIKFS
jgi:hypothetical protein